MKILWIKPFVVTNVCDQCKARFAEALKQFGHEVTTIIVGSSGSWEVKGFYKLFFVPQSSSVFVKILNQVRYIFRLSMYHGDVVFLGEDVAHLSIIASFIRRLLHKPWKIIIDIRSLPADAGKRVGGQKRFWSSLKLGLPHVDALTVITEGIKEIISKELNTTDIPTQVWETAVDKSFCDMREIKLHEGINSSGHEINLLYLGTISPKRGIDTAIKAMVSLKKDKKSYGLHIVGDGPARHDLVELTTKLGLQNWVHFWGTVPYAEVPACIAACDAGILTLPNWVTWNTSSPIKLFEYMALGKPVIVSDIPAHRNLLSNKSFAIFLDETTPEGFCKAVRTFGLLPTVKRNELGAEAREFISSYHTWDHRAAVLLPFLESFVDC